MTEITKNDIGEILDLLIDEKIIDYSPNPDEFQSAIDQVYDRYLRELADVKKMKRHD